MYKILIITRADNYGHPPMVVQNVVEFDTPWKANQAIAQIKERGGNSETMVFTKAIPLFSE